MQDRGGFIILHIDGTWRSWRLVGKGDRRSLPGLAPGRGSDFLSRLAYMRNPSLAHTGSERPPVASALVGARENDEAVDQPRLRHLCVKLHFFNGLLNDCQQVIKNELKDQNVRIACIGPAGENLSRMACIINEVRAAGRMHDLES